jgi:putrescine transport system substrate-binding protein
LKLSVKKILCSCSLFFAAFFFVAYTANKISKDSCVNLYDWYGVLPREVLDQFEKESGIKVYYDVFDNNEMLEAKLLASNSGYDVVFPTVTPYGARQLRLGVYQKINKDLLPNLGKIEPFLLEKMQTVDKNLDFLLPYYWGTTGIAFDEDKLNQLIPEHPKDSYSLLFDEKIVAILKDAGISFLQEAIDVFPHVLNYLGLDGGSRTYRDLATASKYIANICPYVRRFSSARIITDLILGDACVAQAWSGEALKAIEDAKKMGRNIRYIIPKEGGDLWIDAIAIPIGAPHTRNAHKFIDFLLRPDISAKITNKSKIATMVVDSKKFIKKKILNNVTIFPSEELRANLFFCPPLVGPEGDRYERIRSRIWALLKMRGGKIDFYIDEVIKLEKPSQANIDYSYDNIETK